MVAARSVAGVPDKFIQSHTALRARPPRLIECRVTAAACPRWQRQSLGPRRIPSPTLADRLRTPALAARKTLLHAAPAARFPLSHPSDPGPRRAGSDRGWYTQPQ